MYSGRVAGPIWGGHTQLEEGPYSHKPYAAWGHGLPWAPQAPKAARFYTGQSQMGNHRETSFSIGRRFPSAPALRNSAALSRLRPPPVGMKG